MLLQYDKGILALATRYTVHAIGRIGQLGGTAPFDLTWTFTIRDDTSKVPPVVAQSSN